MDWEMHVPIDRDVLLEVEDFNVGSEHFIKLKIADHEDFYLHNIRELVFSSSNFESYFGLSISYFMNKFDSAFRFQQLIGNADGRGYSISNKCVF